jgi:hypothetical protein
MFMFFRTQVLLIRRVYTQTNIHQCVSGRQGCVQDEHFSLRSVDRSRVLVQTRFRNPERTPAARWTLAPQRSTIRTS